MIQSLFKDKKIFIGFIEAGDGGIDYTVECALQLVAGGVDILELGLPFSDPIADGPVIQQAAARALSSGTHAETLLTIAREIRQQSSVPLVLFTYFNPLLQQGTEYLNKAKAAGFNAVLIVDLPLLKHHHLDPYFQAVIDAGLEPIILITPSTSESRMKALVSIPSAFIYYVCQKGTTGMKDALPADYRHQIQKIRACTDLPIATGFGIANQEIAAEVLSVSDGMIVGSAFVRLMAERCQPQQLKLLAESLDVRVTT